MILADRLKRAALRLNPHIPEAVIDDALARFCDRRSAMSLVAANREIDSLIRDGIPVEYENSQGRKEQERVKRLDFNQPSPAKGRNEFLALSQL